MNMVGPLFTAFAMIATGRVELPPLPHHPPVPHVRAMLPERETKTDKDRRRR
jgi:hypothetical protein